MFAIARPVTGSQQNIRHFPQARSAVACIDGVQCDQPISQSPVRVTGRSHDAKHADRGNPALDTVVIREIKAERDRPGEDAAFVHVEPNGAGATVGHEMLAMRPLHDADIG